MSTKGPSELCQLFLLWRSEDRNLAACIDEIRDWMSEVNQLGIPHFGETASRLEPLRTTLLSHFKREDEILARLAEFYAAASPEIQSFRGQTGADHQQLISRLDDLHTRLKEVDPPFESWTAAMHEVDLFFEAMEQHERNESDRVAMLTPSECLEGNQSN